MWVLDLPGSKAQSCPAASMTQVSHLWVPHHGLCSCKKAGVFWGQHPGPASSDSRSLDSLCAALDLGPSGVWGTSLGLELALLWSCGPCCLSQDRSGAHFLTEAVLLGGNGEMLTWTGVKEQLGHAATAALSALAWTATREDGLAAAAVLASGKPLRQHAPFVHLRRPSPWSSAVRGSLGGTWTGWGCPPLGPTAAPGLAVLWIAPLPSCLAPAVTVARPSLRLPPSAA